MIFCMQQLNAESDSANVLIHEKQMILYTLKTKLLVSET